MREFLKTVKIEHTLFSLPYLFIGGLLAGARFQDIKTWTLILLAGVGARGAGMLLNRIVDRHIDAQNPRTANRSLATGKLRPGQAWAGVVVFSLLLAGAAWGLNKLCFVLSPIPLLAFYLYPYAKRFTPLCHLALGLVWSIATAGAWLAVRASFSGFWPGAVLSLSVALWVAGFDIIYALLDVDFDRKHGLHSGPADWGVSKALWVSRTFHVISFGLWVYIGIITGLGPGYFASLWVVVWLFVAQHIMARKDPKTSFFTVNALVGFVLLLGVIVGIGI